MSVGVTRKPRWNVPVGFFVLSLRLGQDCSDNIFVLPGDGDGLTADGYDIRSGERGMGNIDQKGTVDAEKTGTKEILPLGDAVAVAIPLAITGDDPHFGIMGFNIKDIIHYQGNLLVVRCKGNVACRRILNLQPFCQQVISIGQYGQNGGYENGIAQHGGYRPFFPA